MQHVSLKEKLRRDGKAFGPMVFEFFTSGMPAIVAATGADFVLYDMEHTGIGFETLKQQVAGCRGLGLAPLVRVPATEYHLIARALDVGVHGIMMPMMESREQAERFVASAYYPPRGRRGAAFGVAHDDYTGGSPTDKIKAAHDRTLLITQIETAEGLKNVEAIAAVPEIDVIWVGHFDLTNSLGIPGQFQHPDYLAAIRRVVQAAQDNGKITGFMVSDESWAREYWRHGFHMLAYGLDHDLYQTALRAGIKTLHSLELPAR
jgi:2-dehydro-3-deoxyglucarate aldolase/4-hydroxy-2-oxoheptanedioate aldolase